MLQGKERKCLPFTNNWRTCRLKKSIYTEEISRTYTVDQCWFWPTLQAKAIQIDIASLDFPIHAMFL